MNWKPPYFKNPKNMIILIPPYNNDLGEPLAKLGEPSSMWLTTPPAAEPAVGEPFITESSHYITKSSY